MLLPENARKIFIAVNAKTSKVVVRHFENTVIVKGLSAGYPRAARRELQWVHNFYEKSDNVQYTIDLTMVLKQKSNKYLKKVVLPEPKIEQI